MAALERLIVSQGWHLPRWRTSNTEYGKFYRLRHQGDDVKAVRVGLGARIDALQQCSAWIEHLNLQGISPDIQTRPPPTDENVTATDRIWGDSNMMAQIGSRNGYIVKLVNDGQLEESLPKEQVNTGQADLPWKPKPLKPMFLFEKKAKELERDKALERLTPSKRKKTGEWRLEPSPSKRQQTSSLHDAVHPATRRYNYYKFYGKESVLFLIEEVDYPSQGSPSHTLIVTKSHGSLGDTHTLSSSRR